MFSLPVIALLASTWLALAAPTGETVRVDDVLVLDGTALRFEPPGGLNDTTRDPKWQAEYLQTLDPKVIDAIYRKPKGLNDIPDETPTEGRIVARKGSDCVRIAFQD